MRHSSSSTPARTSYRHLTPSWSGALISLALFSLAAYPLLFHRSAVSTSTTLDLTTSASRRLLIRDIPEGTVATAEQRPQQYCNNTVSGRWLIADDKGYVCMRHELHFETGCCAGGKQYSCDTCSLPNQCCAEFERCVSCCLEPKHNAANMSLTAYRSPDRDSTGRWASPFEYCRGKCRTTSRSTVHENAYLDPHHHCFSPAGKPTTPSPPVPNLPDSVTLVMSEKGQNCLDACAAHQSQQPLMCSPEHYAALNDCNRLRAHFACEAGCDSQAGPATEHPGYVVTAAPKQQRPAMCLVDPTDNVEGTCEGLNHNLQRLCPCVQAPVGQQQQQQQQLQQQQEQQEGEQAQT